MDSLLKQPTNQLVKNSPTIIFCLPGRSFSNNFLLSWSELLIHLYKLGFNVKISQKYTSNVYYVRNMCLGGDVMRGVSQKPFNGMHYDYIMWIDSDIVFDVNQFLTLLRHNKPIVSGLYLMDGGTKYATVKDWDIEFFKKNSSFQFLTPKFVEKWKQQHPNKLMEVEYTGFGFLLCKKGVFEKINYPWFEPVYENKIAENVVDFCSEDVSFCKKILKKGLKIYIDPNIIVGHEKIITYR